jgi:TPR repeat protein
MNRYAHLLANGRGVAPDPVEAIKWHLLARQAGVSDLFLDGYMGTADPKVVDEARSRADAFARG